MKEILFSVLIIASGMMLQGCQTTKSSICKVCHPEEAAQAEASASAKESPIQKVDAWIQKNMW